MKIRKYKRDTVIELLNSVLNSTEAILAWIDALDYKNFDIPVLRIGWNAAENALILFDYEEIDRIKKDIPAMIGKFEASIKEAESIREFALTHGFSLVAFDRHIEVLEQCCEELRWYQLPYVVA